MGKYDGIIKDIICSYKELGNVWKVGKVFNIPGQTIHKMLTDSGDISKMNYFTKNDEDVLIEKYEVYVSDGRLDDLAKELGRTKNFICRKAKKLGLTKSNRPFMGDKEVISRSMKDYIKNNGHPKGMSGKKHSEETKKLFSDHCKSMWEDPKSKFNSKEFRQLKSDRMSKWQSTRKDKGNSYSRTKKGWWSNGDKKYYMRSSWEMNYAVYLDFLVIKKEILDWEYETDTFWFEKIKRGVRSYTPDFKVTLNSGDIEFHEVKGWMDAKSKTKLNRMRIYHPKVVMKLIDGKVYKSIMAHQKTYESIVNKVKNIEITLAK